MQMVIDIDEKTVNEIKDNAMFAGTIPSEILWDITSAIANGTSLPKGHGRLGDLDALEKKIVNGIKAGNYEEGYETFAHINNMDDCIECVKYAPTIIGSDKESEE